MKTDYLVIGSGLAGLTFALGVADSGSVTIVTKREPEESNTSYAQGGIAAAVNDDSPENHARDTIASGAGLCHEGVVREVTNLAPSAINDLIAWGVKFSEYGPDEFDLNIEGGHGRRRILHAGDSTGKEVIGVLLKRVKEHPNIKILSNHIAIDIVPSAKFNPKADNRCIGAYVLNIKQNKIVPISARVTFLATGGAGKIYIYTSNPDIASGDGIAMAFRAKIPVANLEFVQFHPTILYHHEAKSFLISEAVRGEGAILTTCDGKRFMEKYDSRKELATRDVVARAIDHELKQSGDSHVYLDATNIKAKRIKKNFPNIFETCLSCGIDITKEPIPVVPAAHYFCGGVVADLDGTTALPGLLAGGEVACTGFHGANRLASNSLLEAVVVGIRAAKKARHEIKNFGTVEIKPWDPKGSTDSNEEVIISHNWDEIRRLMWNYVGIVRTNKRLERARKRLNLLAEEIKEYYWNFTITSNLIELRNIALTASLVVESALKRRESRGLHYMADYPNENDKFKRDTIICPDNIAIKHPSTCRLTDLKT